MLGFGRLDILQLAEPHRNAGRRIAAIDNVGRIRPGPARGGGERLGAIESVVEAVHSATFSGVRLVAPEKGNGK